MAIYISTFHCVINRVGEKAVRIWPQNPIFLRDTIPWAMCRYYVMGRDSAVVVDTSGAGRWEDARALSTWKQGGVTKQFIHFPNFVIFSGGLSPPLGDELTVPSLGEMKRSCGVCRRL